MIKAYLGCRASSCTTSLVDATSRLKSLLLHRLLLLLNGLALASRLLLLLLLLLFLASLALAVAGRTALCCLPRLLGSSCWLLPGLLNQVIQRQIQSWVARHQSVLSRTGRNAVVVMCGLLLL
jgi:hypothetical protein